MARIAPTIVLTLMLVIAGLLLWLQSARHAVSDAQASGELYKSAAESLAQTIGTLDAERALHESIAIQAIDRQHAMTRARQRDQAELQRLKQINASLLAYLDAGVPHAVADWLWLPSGYYHTGDSPEAAGNADATDAEAAAAPSSVTHAAGWQWCRDVERALDSCNADKAALRAWTEGRPE